MHFCTPDSYSVNSMLRKVKEQQILTNVKRLTLMNESGSKLQRRMKVSTATES